MQSKLPAFFFTVVLTLLTAFNSQAFEYKESRWIARPIVVNWTEERGLQSENIQEICKGKNGYIWLGTYEGLIRFDGIEFDFFSTINTPNFPHNSVEHIFAGEDGTIWFGGSGPGLGYFKNGKFGAIGKADVLKNEVIIDITQDSEESIWLLTARTIFKLEGSELINFPVPEECSKDTLFELCIDNDGELWLGTSSGVYHLKDGWQKLSHPLLSRSKITSVRCDSQNRKWVQNGKGDIIEIEDNEVSLLVENKSYTQISEIAFDEEGDMWFTHTKGYCHLKGDTLTCFKNSPLDISYLRGPLVVDRERNFWTVRSERNLVQTKIPRFEYYSSADGLPSSPITGVARRKDELVISSWTSLYRKTDSSFERLATNPELTKSSIRGVIPDSKGNLWATADMDGIVKIDENNEVQFFKKEINFPENYGRCLLETPSGKMWIGTDKGLYEVENDQFHSLERFKSSKIIQMNITPDGSIWVCVSSDGVHRLKDNKWSTYSVEDGLASAIAFHCTQIGKEDFLISTNLGLSRIKHGKIKTLNASNGLPRDSVFYSIQDNLGFTWFATNPGIYKVRNGNLINAFESEDEKIEATFYDRSAGILNSEITAPALPYLDERSGKFYLPSRGGVLVVNPSEEPQPLPPLKTQINTITVNEKKIPFEGEHSLFLGKGVQRVTFNFTAPSFYYPSRTQYEVKLQGFDNNWIDAEGARQYTYTNLKPGDYTFMVRSRNSDGVWDKKGDHVSIELAPYFYQTLTFRVILVALLVLSTAALFYSRIKGLQARKLELESIVKERTEELQIALEKAHAANKSKNDFLAMMSHEIRTPMNGIIGMIDLLLGSKLPKQETEFAEIAKSSAGSLMGILNDILDLSRIESDKMVFESIEFQLSKTIDDSLRLSEQRAANKGISLTVKRDPNVPENLMGDPTRLRQVILNLLSNAVKFTEKGGVTLEIRALDQTDTACNLEFTVKDTGIGIEQTYLDNLFNSFEQGDASTTRKYGGSGLGLAICKRLLTYMNGSIRCESVVGKGSSFIFTAKFNLAEQQAETVFEQPNFVQLQNGEGRQKTILLVEDVKVNQTIVKHLIKKTPHQLDFAENGRIALEKLSEKPFDLVLMDISMPEMDGVEATHKIREGVMGINPDTIIVALTANAMTGDRERFLGEGMDDYLSKPIKSQLFYQTIARYLEAV